jgi:hypothetical protein
MAESRRIELHSRSASGVPGIRRRLPTIQRCSPKFGRDGTIRTCVILLPRQVGILYPTSRNFGGHGASRTPTSPVQTERAPINTTRPKTNVLARLDTGFGLQGRFGEIR